MQLCDWSNNKEIQTLTTSERQLKVPNNQNGIGKRKAISKLIFHSKKVEDKNY